MRDKSSENLLKQEEDKESKRDDNDIHKKGSANRVLRLFFLQIAAKAYEATADNQEKYEGSQKNVSRRLSEVPDR